MSRSSRQRLYGGKSEPYRKVWQGGQARRLHRVLAEEKLGRKLKVGEVVHHRQGFEDLPENLVVLPSQRHHMLVHHYERRERQGIQHLFELEELLQLIK